MHKLQFIVAAVVLISATGFFTYQYYQQNNPHPATNNETITAKGVFTCLIPKKDIEHHTFECAFGLQTESGDYYGLGNANPEQPVLHDVPKGITIEVKGSFYPVTDPRYQTIGVIEVAEVTRL